MLLILSETEQNQSQITSKIRKHRVPIFVVRIHDCLWNISEKLYV